MTTLKVLFRTVRPKLVERTMKLSGSTNLHKESSKISF